MFSRSFINSRNQENQGIAARARVSHESVLRSPACSGEHNYTYTPTGFRAFQDAANGNYSQNLINDYQQVYEEGKPTLPYHAALTALLHNTASKSVATFLNQPRITQQLIEMHNTAPAPAPAPEPTWFAAARQQLAKMKFELPPPHPRRTIVYRTPDGRDLSEINTNTNFDPTTFESSARNTFVKTCCTAYDSVHECRCFKRCSRTSVTYVNDRGESIHVYYLSRKTDYHNLTQSYPMTYQPDDEHIPHSPREDVSDSDLFPWSRDYDFEGERADAWCAEQQGFTHVWSSKRAKHRHQRRQRRQQQLASGELPEHGLIIVTFDIDDVWPVKPLSLHAQYRRQQREKFEEIQQYVRFYESWAEEHQRRPEPVAPALPALPALPRNFHTKGLTDLQMQHLIMHEQQYNATRDIQRPLSNTSIVIAHAASRLQVTEISALKIHQLTRLTAIAALTALLAIRFSAAPGIASSIATTLYHRAIQLIVRRATGSMACAQQISAPYIKFENPFQCLPRECINELRAEAEYRFDTENPSGVPLTIRSAASLSRPCSKLGGPIEYHTAKYYAEKCLELIGNPDIPTTAAARWTNLDDQVLRVRRGEITAHEVFASPQHNNWVFMVHYTYVIACRQFLSAIELWRDVHESARSFAGPRHTCPSVWRDSHIRKDSPAYVQCAQIVHDMYRFILRAQRIISPQYMAVFGINQRYVNSIITRTKFLAYNDGDETSALAFGFLMPAMMTPDVHLNICVEAHVFQHPELYVKMSDPVFGPIKKQLRDMIPSRHTGTIDRTTLMNEPRIQRRA